MKKILWTILLFVITSNLTHANTHWEFNAASILATKKVIKMQVDEAWYNLWSNITRKEIMKVVMNLSWKVVTDKCEKKFSDVTNDWGCKYIESALWLWFIAKNPTFRPNDTITKAESMKLILKARGIEKSHNTDDWRDNYMLTAYDNWVITQKYSDHNTKATRGWIFKAAVGKKSSSSSVSGEDKVVALPTPKSQIPNEDDYMPGITYWYHPYNEELLWRNSSTVLFFNASWCPSCIVAHHSLDSEEYSSWDIMVLDIDYDSNEKLRKKYAVASQHTFVQVNAEWELVKKWVWWITLEDIEEKVE